MKVRKRVAVAAVVLSLVGGSTLVGSIASPAGASVEDKAEKVERKLRDKAEKKERNARDEADDAERDARKEAKKRLKEALD